MDDGTYSGWFDVRQGLGQGCAPMLKVAFNEFSEDDEVMADMAKVKKKVTKGKGKNAEKTEAVISISGMLHADGAGHLSRSAGSLEKIVPIIVRVAGQIGLMVSEPGNRNHVHARSRDEGLLGQTVRDDVQTNGKRFLYLGWETCRDDGVEKKINHRVH